MNTSGLRFASRSFLALAAVLGVGAGMLGCPVINAEHCANGGPACAEGLACSKCEIGNNGCVALDAIADPDCMFLDSAGPTTDDSTTSAPPTETTPATETTTGTTPPTATESSTTIDVTVSTTEETTTTTTSTDPSETDSTTGPECDPAANTCAGDKPYCLVDTCVACTEIDCEDLDPEKPTCNEELGVCVQCVDSNDCTLDSEPFCNPDTATCQACSMHDQCPETACNLESGECFPEENVLYVERSVGCDDTGPGTDPMNPLCLLSEALTRAVVGEALTIKVKQGTTMAQDQSNVVMPGTVVAIVANGGPPTLERNGSFPALDVTANSTVFVDHLLMTNPTPNETINMVRCTNATLWLESTNVFNGRVGVMATNCELNIRRSVVFQNQNGGIDVTSDDMGGVSKLRLENSYITDNGEVFGLRLTNNSFADVIYSTFVGNSSMVSPIACTSVPPNNLTVRNSLLAYPPNMFFVGCKLAMPDDHNVKTTEATPQALVNAGYGSNYSLGVLRAKVDGGLKDQALWKPGDPTIDFDGHPRPKGDEEMPDYAGADVPPP
jgi:hypothetical protein